MQLFLLLFFQQFIVSRVFSLNIKNSFFSVKSKCKLVLRECKNVCRNLSSRCDLHSRKLMLKNFSDKEILILELQEC